MVNNSSGAQADILIVEDSAVEAEMLRRILVKTGYRVTLARNGRAGLQALREHPCALVMSDIQMPLMNGYQLCREIKHDDALWNIPVILLTALSEPEDIIEAIKAGADSYLTKPFVVDIMLEQIRSLLNTPISRKRTEERRTEQLEYNGKHHYITADNQQILSLLLSVYRNTIAQNQELMNTRAQLNLLNDSLDQKVQERTAALQESEVRLRRLNERFFLATHAARLGIWDLDLQKNQLLWDEGMYALYGIKREDFDDAYTAWLKGVHPDDRASSDEIVKQAQRGEREYDTEFRVVWPDGGIHYLKAYGHVVRGADGKPLRMTGINFDITARKRAEEELWRYKNQLEETVQQRTAELLLARDAAEAANKAKSLFLANMSHELRTPLNAILGFSSLMRRDPQLTESQRGNLDIINHSGEHLLSLINDVLEMAKIEAGRLQLEIAPFDLGQMVTDVAEMMNLRAQEKGLQLLLDQSSEFPRYIKGDEARLRQILVNLVGNAVKFTEQGGVTIRLGVKQCALPTLVVEVEDSGPGISPEDRQRLFEPFMQFVKGGSQKGTGLGLAISRRFIQMMGGVISVESTVGKGSLFRVELPVETANPADVLRPEKQGEVAGLAPGQPSYRILIAEDQHENRLLLGRLMTGLGLDVKVAENGEQCVKLFQDWRPHLIWMDRRMPVMDGVEATQRIRQLPNGQDVKIVAVTASAFKEQQQEMLDAGMDDFVRKPYRFEEIYGSLARQLGIKYLYRSETEEQAASVTPTPEMLAVLPSALREELKKALENLDSKQISAALLQVNEVDTALGSALSRLADNFDYPAILNALNETNERR